MDTMHLEGTEGWVADAHNQQKRRYYILFCTQIHMLVDHDAVPARNVAELVALPARSWASSPSAPPAAAIAGELFRSLAAIDIAHVPYRGNPPLLPDCSRAAPHDRGDAWSYVPTAAARRIVRGDLSQSAPGWCNGSNNGGKPALRAQLQWGRGKSATDDFRFVDAYQSRWALAPFYLELALSLLLLYHLLVELAAFVLKIAFASESEVILGVLRLIDLCFTGNLIVIVIFSGFEHFVSRIDAGDHDRPDWMTKVDFVISAIQVLKAFMNIERYDTAKLGWPVGIHALFLGSLLVVVLTDRLSAPIQHPSERRSGTASR
jgi:uncharacterized protein (TIGR00645 family)